MQPLDADNPLHGVIVTRPSVECHDPVEFDYYKHAQKPWCDELLCAYCAGGTGEDRIIDEAAIVEWKTVLPLCPTYKGTGAHPIARYRRKNGTAIAERASTQNARQRRAAQASTEARAGASAAGDAPAVQHRRRVRSRRG